MDKTVAKQEHLHLFGALKGFNTLQETPKNFQAHSFSEKLEQEQHN